jgi:hypothetical protein
LISKVGLNLDNFKKTSEEAFLEYQTNDINRDYETFNENK